MAFVVESANVICSSVCENNKIRVLHVDDDAEFLEVAKQRLEGTGYFDVETAASAEEALKKLKASAFDAVVADYQLPKMNGLELLRELKRMGNETPFFLFTCRGKAEVAVEALNSGVERYVDKKGDAESIYGELERGICETVKKRRAERVLKNSESQLKLISENIQDVLILTAGDFKCTYVSASIKRILGYEPNELVGRSIYEFVHPDDLPVVMATIKKASGFEGKMLIRFRRLNGTYAVMEGHGKISTNLNGHSTSVVVILRDVTESKKTQEKLTESEEKYRSLFVNMLDGFAYCQMIWDENGKPIDFVFLEVNDAFEKLTGLKRASVVGKRVTEVLPSIEEANVELFEKCGRVALTGEKEVLESYFKPLDMWFSISAYSPKKNYFAVVFEDITERKRNTEKMQFQAGLLNTLGQSIIATDKDSLVTYWNRAAEDLHGWSEAEMRGQNISKIIPEGIVQQISKIVERLNVKESWSGEVTAKRRDGAFIPTMVTIAPILDEKNEVVGAASVETDISEQKWMQEVTNEAVQKVSELNEKLQVVESLTRHDIRNKLAALNGRLFLLKKRFAEYPHASENLRELEFLSRQILRILEFERIYVQVGAEELSVVNVENSVAEAGSLFSDLQGVQLVNGCRGLTVLADSLLRQLFYNLIDNSLRHGEKISKIHVRFEEEPNCLKLIYEDDGVGISDETRNNLFTKGFGKNTGYGLYLIRRICEAYGWAIQETGKQGEGAQFTMTIPKFSEAGKEKYQIKL
jgi:PAS domain S-box-containing protein